MPDALDDPSAAHRAERETGEIAAEHETSHGGLEILDRHPQGDQGAEEAVGELDATRREDKRSDLCAHRSARPHPCSLPYVAREALSRSRAFAAAGDLWRQQTMWFGVFNARRSPRHRAEHIG